ncbi:DNA-binding domain protein [Vibrio phage 1.186.O._10N.286.49.E3]|nr:DNA-binding domain protein [Vibrio phage 1.186.O._10N.286.49.E3]AUR99173.1 DNA-binding domain protein [Vibrio phage 1.263.A._10N.286.51.B1]AUR99249.1 DNA-binding domain protein [Vibrio phage 1.263.B._10N.286.51.B1]
MARSKLKDYPDADYLARCFSYCDSDGSLTWKARPTSHFPDSRASKIWNTKYSGKLAGRTYKNKNGKCYKDVSISNSSYQQHRIVYILHNGTIEKEMQIDHINGDSTDNRIENLRLVDGFENHKNTRRHSNNTSGVTGVSWHSQAGKWNPRIQVDNKYISLGLFSDFSKAVKARKEAEVKYGFHNNHGSERPL